MNKNKILILKGFRKIYLNLFKEKLALPKSDQNPDSVSNKIQKLLLSDKPCMIARFGSNELNCLINYIYVKNKNINSIEFIKGNIKSWWWESSVINQMNFTGFFPPTIKNIEEFCELMLNDINEVDILGSWQYNEHYLKKKLTHVEMVRFIYIEPFWSEIPWTKVLKGKKVLVVHPFSETIEFQYKKRKLLFENDLLPDFDLKTMKAVQSVAGEKTPFKDWFEALDFMKSKIDEANYDICLIGAGAYGFPLAAHVKRSGKKAVHIGGSLQLLFGIKGKRWENPDYGSSLNLNYSSLFNENWVRPQTSETPANSSNVEDSCYW